jgi:hypothetical protein
MADTLQLLELGFHDLGHISPAVHGLVALPPDFTVLEESKGVVLSAIGVELAIPLGGAGAPAGFSSGSKTV